MNHQEKRVAHMRWKIGNQQGCCGIGTVSRLTGITVSEASVRSSLLRWERNADRAPIMSPFGYTAWKTWDMNKIMTHAQRMLPTKTVHPVPYHTSTPQEGWWGMATDLDTAFAAVLDGMKSKKYAIYFFSDNVAGAGDVHLGPFNTRDFVTWLFTKNLGQIQTTGPITSLRTDRKIQGWMFTPNWSNCNSKIEIEKTKLIQQIKELNSVTGIKEKRTQDDAERRSEEAALADTIARGWGDE